MERKTIQELEVNLNDIPDIFSVVINLDDLELENNSKLFQLALKEDISDNLEDILVYSADFKNEMQTITPLKASSFDNEGVFRKDLFYVFPHVYRKMKDTLVIIE